MCSRRRRGRVHRQGRCARRECDIAGRNAQSFVPLEGRELEAAAPPRGAHRDLTGPAPVVVTLHRHTGFVSASSAVVGRVGGPGDRPGRGGERWCWASPGSFRAVAAALHARGGVRRPRRRAGSTGAGWWSSSGARPPLRRVVGAEAPDAAHRSVVRRGRGPAQRERRQQRRAGRRPGRCRRAAAGAVGGRFRPHPGGDVDGGPLAPRRGRTAGAAVVALPFALVAGTSNRPLGGAVVGVVLLVVVSGSQPLPHA